MTIATERQDVTTGREQARLALAASVAAERFGSPAMAWIHAVAALHAVANFVAEHPVLPVPRSATVHFEVDTLAELEHIAEHFGVKTYGEHPQCSVQIMHGQEDPIYAGIIVALRREDRPL